MDRDEARKNVRLGMLLEADCRLSAFELALPMARRWPLVVGGWSVSGAVTGGSSGAGRAAPITASAVP